MNEQEEKNYRLRRLCVIGGSLAILTLFIWITIRVGKPLVQLASEPARFDAWIDERGAWGRIIFLAIQVLQVVVAMIPGEVLEIGSGYAFGAWEATLLCAAGAAIGSAIIFALTRWLGVKLVESFISREKIAQLHWMRNVDKLNNLIFWVFFIPGTPKDLLTYFVGLTPISLRNFLIISTLARIPSIVSSTFGGHALREQNYLLAATIFVGTGVVSFLGKCIYDRIVKRGQQKKQGAPPKE